MEMIKADADERARQIEQKFREIGCWDTMQGYLHAWNGFVIVKEGDHLVARDATEYFNSHGLSGFR